jgi:amino acid transporter
MLVLLVVSGLRIGSVLAVHVTLAILFPVLAATCWGIWAAPTSRHRLHDPPRLIAQIILFVITGVLAAAAHLMAWGLAFTVAAVVVLSLTRVFPSRPRQLAGTGPGRTPGPAPVPDERDPA